MTNFKELKSYRPDVPPPEPSEEPDYSYQIVVDGIKCWQLQSSDHEQELAEEENLDEWARQVVRASGFWCSKTATKKELEQLYELHELVKDFRYYVTERKEKKDVTL